MVALDHDMRTFNHKQIGLFSMVQVSGASVIFLMILCSCRNSQIKLKPESVDSGMLQPGLQIDPDTSRNQQSLVGHWKMNELEPPGVRLPNFLGEYRNLTLEFENDSILKFHLEGLADSIAEYEFKMIPTGFKLYRGDVVCSANVKFINPSEMAVCGIFKHHDTLMFKKIK